MKRDGLRNGFTIIELLIFIAIFSAVMIAFISIFLTVLKVYNRQSASAEVDRQSQFLLQNFQNDIQLSSVVDMPADAPTSTLKLRMPVAALDPTYVYLQNGVVYYTASTSAPEALTTGKVNVTNLIFTKRANSSGHDSVQLSFSMEYVGSPSNYFAQSLSTSIARVSAATFDSSLIASTSNAYSLGVGNGNWANINGSIFFSNSNSNVGIGVIPAANSKFEVYGGDAYVSGAASGLILKGPSGSNCFRLSITNGGSITTTSVTCPD